MMSEQLLPQSNEPMPEVPSEQPFEYQLLTGHRRTDGTYKTSEQLRTEYLTRTDELIRKMTEGVEVTDPITGERSVEIPDEVVWLDKSARPLSWLTREMWPKYAAKPGEPVPPMPQFRYVNIDREQWVNTVDPNGVGVVDINQVDKSIIRSLRSVFVAPQHKQEGISEALDTAPSELDHKTVMIVDEVYATGRTLQIAEKFFRAAFPDAKIATTHWMGSVAANARGGMGNADLPVWYREDSPRGRGVGNRNQRESQRSDSRTQKLGSWFLSTRFPEPDQASLRLRDELKRLAHDENVLIVPSMQRDIDDVVERAERFNGVDFDTFRQMKREQSEREK